MNIKEANEINLSLISHKIRIKALESCLTEEQRKIFDANLKESKDEIRKQFEESLRSKPKELAEFLKRIDKL
ncbi:hypothetical protein [Flavobacterium panacagri]|uniref:hypothetical protein n=1 Tax=Flavobacterium panacagri TaxID=3034146 RepID=UPI0025A4F7EA|nr:hypothetical protein [Flavobacterium panacagri]